MGVVLVMPRQPSQADVLQAQQRLFRSQFDYADSRYNYVTDLMLLKQAAGIAKGSGEPNKEKVGKVTRHQLEEIAKTKQPDLTAADLDAAVRTIAGTARSMGIETEGV